MHVSLASPAMHLHTTNLMSISNHHYGAHSRKGRPCNQRRIHQQQEPCSCQWAQSWLQPLLPALPQLPHVSAAGLHHLTALTTGPHSQVCAYQKLQSPPLSVLVPSRAPPGGVLEAPLRTPRALTASVDLAVLAKNNCQCCRPQWSEPKAHHAPPDR